MMNTLRNPQPRRGIPSLSAGMVAAMLVLPSLAAAEQRICVEAESLLKVTPPMVAVSLPDSTDKAPKEASGHAYLEIPQGRGNPPEVTTGEATFEFDVQEKATFVLWCRVWWEDTCGNSLTMQVNDGLPFAFGQDATYKTWHWVKAPPGLKQLTLEPGRHTLTIRNREDGVRLDQILLTSERKFVPVDIEPVTASPAPGKTP